MQTQFRLSPGSADLQRRFDAGSTSVQIGHPRSTPDITQIQQRPISGPSLAKFSCCLASVRGHVRPKLGPSQTPVRFKPDSSQSQVRLTPGSLQSQYRLNPDSLQTKVGPGGDRGQIHCGFAVDSSRAQFGFMPAASQIQLRATSAPAQIQFPTNPDPSQAPRRFTRRFRPNSDQTQLLPAACSPPAPTQLRSNVDPEQIHSALSPAATRLQVSPIPGRDASTHEIEVRGASQVKPGFALTLLAISRSLLGGAPRAISRKKKRPFWGALLLPGRRSKTLNSRISGCRKMAFSQNRIRVSR